MEKVNHFHATKMCSKHHPQAEKASLEIIPFKKFCHTRIKNLKKGIWSEYQIKRINTLTIDSEVN